MSRPEVNRSGELEVFARVVELGGFSAAARSFDMTPSAVSKLVARLEQRLYLLRFPLHHDATIRREAARQGIDPAWVAAEIRAESVFDPKARSSADARGLMQVVPATGAEVAARLGLRWTGGNDLYDADTNIAIGTAYLRQLMHT